MAEAIENGRDRGVERVELKHNGRDLVVVEAQGRGNASVGVVERDKAQ